MSKTKYIITKRIYRALGVDDLGVRLYFGKGSYNEKSSSIVYSKYGITKENYVCSLVYNRRTDELRKESPILYQYIVNDNRQVDDDKLINCLKEMMNACREWIDEPLYYGMHELILFEENGVFKYIDNSKH
jgi:hypothetical protein